MDRSRELDDVISVPAFFDEESATNFHRLLRFLHHVLLNVTGTARHDFLLSITPKLLLLDDVSLSPTGANRPGTSTWPPGMGCGIVAKQRHSYPEPDH